MIRSSFILMLIPTLSLAQESATEPRQAEMLGALSTAVSVHARETPSVIATPVTAERIRALNPAAQRCVGDSQEDWSFELVVRRSGRVRAVSRVGGVPDESAQRRVVRCLERLMRTLRLERRAGDDVTITLRVGRPNLESVLGGGNGVARIAPRSGPQLRVGQLDVRGSLSPDVIRRIVRQNYLAIRYCYEQELTNAAGLEGRLILRFVVETSGSVRAVNIAEGATLQNATVHSCITRNVARWRFPQRAGGGVVPVSVPLVFTAGAPRTQTSMQTRPQPQIRSGNAEVRGALSREVIRRVIRRHSNEARHCYEQALVRNPELDGTVHIRFVIGADGRVQESQIVDDRVPDAAVAQCIAVAVRRWRFPEPEGGGIVVVNYPFVFRPR